MKIGSKFSNRTKVIGGMTILLGVGTIISAVKDNAELKKIDADAELLEETMTEVADAIEEVATAEITEL